MSTPISDYVQSYAHAEAVRFHMPGHKGASFVGCEACDITEIDGADDLYHAEGIILQSEQTATAHFGSGHTFYSAGGSSQSIRAMLYLAMVRYHDATTGKRPLFWAGRNAHKAFHFAAALLDFDVHWLIPTQPAPLCRCAIAPDDLRTALSATDTLPCAVYLTSPDYHGNILDAAGLAAVCAQFDLPLLIDNAHGAYLRFLPSPCHPLQLGAAMCCDSAHKTLPVLTGGSYLHLAHGVDFDDAQVRMALAMFGSSSPSYLVLQSLDLCNDYLQALPQKLAQWLPLVADCKRTLTAQGWQVHHGEPLKLTLHTAPSGWTGDDLMAHLATHNIYGEYAEREYLVLMLTPENTVSDLHRLIAALALAPQRAPLAHIPQAWQPAQPVCTLRQAMLAPSQAVPTTQALGRICAAPVVTCPPAVPLVLAGERITQEQVDLLQSYGCETVRVVLFSV